MYCEKCGAVLDNNNACPNNCFTQQITIEDINKILSEHDACVKESSKKSKFSGKCIVGFVLSLIGIIVAAIPCGIIGVIFASLGLKEVDMEDCKGKGLAISGMIISIIDIVVGAIYILTLI